MIQESPSHRTSFLKATRKIPDALKKTTFKLSTKKTLKKSNMIKINSSENDTCKLLCPIGEFRTQSGGASASTNDSAHGFI